MEVLFATTNQAKVEFYKTKIEEQGIQLLTLKDIGIKLYVDENRKRCN